MRYQLQHVPIFEKFATQAHELEQMTQLIISKLDPSLAPHCRVSNMRDSILILSTTSPAWKHQLRFQSLDLLAALRAEPRWRGLKSIEIRVDYITNYDCSNPAPSQATNSKPKPLSPSNAALIKQLADNINSPLLAVALQKLAAVRFR